MNPSINTSKIILDNQDNKIISQEEAEEAVKTLIQYIGEDPEREGLIETPKRVIKSFNDFMQVMVKTQKYYCLKHLKILRAMTI